MTFPTLVVFDIKICFLCLDVDHSGGVAMGARATSQMGRIGSVGSLLGGQESPIFYPVREQFEFLEWRKRLRLNSSYAWELQWVPLSAPPLANDMRFMQPAKHSPMIIQYSQSWTSWILEIMHI